MCEQLLLFVIFCSAAVIGAEPQTATGKIEPSERVQQLILQLGDDSYLVRTRAEKILQQIGADAYSELQRAKQSSDVEIALRAEHILSIIEQTFLDKEDRAVGFWIGLYVTEPNPAAKAKILWIFANPFEDAADGEGLQTLCRLVRFEENEMLRFEAAKCLIGSPPIRLSTRKKWYRHIRDSISDSSDDKLLQTLAHYAALWCDMDEAAEKSTDTLKDRVRNIGTETLQLLERPENDIQPGSKIDILLYYAVAELQDAAGLTEDRDKTAAAALAVQPEAIRTSEPLQPIELEDDLPMNEHFFVGRCLHMRHRLHWSTAHFQKVIEHADSHVSLRINSSRNAAENAIVMADYAAALAFFDKHNKIVTSPDYTKLRADMPQLLAEVQIRKLYCNAEIAAAAGDWDRVHECVTAGLKDTEMPDNDLTILAYKLYKAKPDMDPVFKEYLDKQFQKIWMNMGQRYVQVPPDQRRQNAVVACNDAAWLLANTDGDYALALTLIETALKADPDDCGILDTLAHVYFLGGHVEEAIKTQEKVVHLAPEVTVFRISLDRFKKKQGK